MTVAGHSQAVFLDRDGVLNRAVIRDGRPYPPASATEFALLPGVVNACRQLRDAGFLLVVVTNQPDIRRGVQREEVVAAMNQILLDQLPLTAIRVCPHDDCDGCRCRKPAPGLLLDAASLYGIDLHASFMVGDRWRDIEAGHRAGCRTVWIDQFYQERAPEKADLRVCALVEAVPWILSVSERTEDNRA